MVKTILTLLARYRPELFELAGAALVVVALSMVAVWAAWLAGGACLLAKSLQLDVERRATEANRR